jgi:hypothetical protein
MRETNGSSALALAAQAARGDMARTERTIKHLHRVGMSAKWKVGFGWAWLTAKPSCAPLPTAAGLPDKEQL